jgi:hypothetical protein
MDQLKANGSLVFVLDDPDDLDFILETLLNWRTLTNHIQAGVTLLQTLIDGKLIVARQDRK